MKTFLRKKINNSFYSYLIKFLILFVIMNTTTNAKEKYTNNLISEDSPYLLQHANNPVDWYAWNKEAFKKAQDENKMIFLSIGYSTCHWCHVMEEESFENEKVAEVLNENFISIKVDREEMPHVDKYFQDVHNLINKRAGGWPLTIILTPQRKAFFAATYIPIDERFGRVGIIQLLNTIMDTFKNERDKVEEVAKNIEDILNQNQIKSFKKQPLEEGLIQRFVAEVDEIFDHKYFGIGQQPKFPHASTIETLLDINRVYKDKKALLLALDMLRAMAKGGINDQIEGGFYRYSVDEKWMIPHFEKMLYTNAELLSAYSKAYEITQDEFYKQVVEDTINFTQIRFEKQNLLYSASDADSLVEDEKEEGAYFVFSHDELMDFLLEKNYSSKEAKEILNYFNITFEGNFENGLTNPYVTSENKLQNLEKIKKDLKEFREKKPYPFIDNKILTSWNSMFISSLFQAKVIDEKYANKALVLLDSLVKNLYIDGVLYHQRLLEKEPKVKALFEDYAFLIQALLSAYEFSFETKYLNLAETLSKEAITKFYKNNAWLMSDGEFKSQEDVYDNSYRSALSQMIDNLLKLAVLNEDLYFQDIAKQSLESNSLILSSRPVNTPWLLRSYMAYHKEYICLKASKEMLEEKLNIDYPFLVKKLSDEKKYLACKVGVCFAFANSLEEIKEKIEETIK